MVTYLTELESSITCIKIVVMMEYYKDSFLTLRIHS